MENEQVKVDDAPDKYYGEWGSIIYNRRPFFNLAIKGTKFYDSNCFFTASIHNVLAEIYLLYPEFVQIPALLDRSMKNIWLFMDDQTFNFWHRLPSPENLMKHESPEFNIKRHSIYFKQQHS